jgi:dolichol kinase
MLSFVLQQHTGFHLSYVLLVLAATLLENIAVRGLDNLLIPLLAAFVLSQLS